MHLIGSILYIYISHHFCIWVNIVVVAVSHFRCCVIVIWWEILYSFVLQSFLFAVYLTEIYLQLTHCTLILTLWYHQTPEIYYKYGTEFCFKWCVKLWISAFVSNNWWLVIKVGDVECVCVSVGPHSAACGQLYGLYEHRYLLTTT